MQKTDQRFKTDISSILSLRLCCRLTCKMSLGRHGRDLQQPV